MNDATINWSAFAFVTFLLLSMCFCEWQRRISVKYQQEQSTKKQKDLNYEYQTFTFSAMDVESGRANAKLNEFGGHGWRVCGQWATGNFLHVFIEKAPHGQKQ